MKKVLLVVSSVALCMGLGFLEYWKIGNYFAEDIYTFFLTGTRIYYCLRFIGSALLVMCVSKFEDLPKFFLIGVMFISLFILLASLCILKLPVNIASICGWLLLPASILFGGSCYKLIIKDRL